MNVSVVSLVSLLASIRDWVNYVDPPNRLHRVNINLCSGYQTVRGDGNPPSYSNVEFRVRKVVKSGDP